MWTLSTLKRKGHECKEMPERENVWDGWNRRMLSGAQWEMVKDTPPPDAALLYQIQHKYQTSIFSFAQASFYQNKQIFLLYHRDIFWPCLEQVKCDSFVFIHVVNSRVCPHYFACVVFVKGTNEMWTLAIKKNDVWCLAIHPLVLLFQLISYSNP